MCNLIKFSSIKNSNLNARDETSFNSSMLYILPHTHGDNEISILVELSSSQFLVSKLFFYNDDGVLYV